MDNARTIIDYAQNEQGAEMRDALYSAIHDKVMAHIETKKQEIAQNLIAPRVQDETGENA
jgi:hypothetical protein